MASLFIPKRVNSIVPNLRLLDALTDDYLPHLHHFSGPVRPRYSRYINRLRGPRYGYVRAPAGNSDFTVNIDMQQFAPEEISVKVVDDSIIIEAKHEEREDEHGFIARQFRRRYPIPDNVNAEKISSKLSSDGILTVTAPRRVNTAEKPNERVIPIVQTNTPVLEQQITQGEKKDDEETANK